MTQPEIKQAASFAPTDQSVTSGESPPVRKSDRYEFLDGLRGLAALYVVFHHAAWQVFNDDIHFRANPILGRIFGPIIYTGHLAVAVFIVLSGFCLMLPMAASPNRQLRGGFRRFIFRRARRILPPYYASLLATMVLVATVPGLRISPQPKWAGALPVFSPEAIVPHAFLFHNLRGEWAYKINPPLWSVATEWQIYFLFPILLLAWRRFGIIASTLLGVLIGQALTFGPQFLGGQKLGIFCCFWYLGLFGYGMAAAVLCRSESPRLVAIRGRFPWFLGVLVTAAFCALSWKLRLGEIWIDNVVGIATTFLIVGAAVACQKERFSPTVRFLELRPVIALGGFSYSLYLAHYPVLAAFNIPLQAGSFTLQERVVITFFGVLPVCLAVSYIFYRFFERPFFPSKLERPEQALKGS